MNRECGRVNMFYRIAADGVLLIHFLWIAFVVLGFPLFLYMNLPRWRIAHLLALVIMIIMQLTRTICPLTYLEAYLKSKGTSGHVYPGQFMIESIEKLIYVENLTLEKITCLTMIFFVVVLLSFWLKPITFKPRIRNDI